MQPQRIDSRVERLEQRMDASEQLPARMDALEGQISQFWAEVRGEFSVVRTEMRELNADTVRQIADTQTQMRELNADTIRQIADTQTQMRVLHADVIKRIGLLGEGSPQPRANRSRKKSR